MSDNANGTSQTISTNPSSGETQTFDQSAVDKCRQFVEDYRKGRVSKGDALLEIQLVLQASIAESSTLTQADFKPGFNHFFELLDQAHDSELRNSHQSPTFEERDIGEGRESEHDEDHVGTESKEKGLRSRLRRRANSEEEEDDEFGDDHEYVLTVKGGESLQKGASSIPGSNRLSIATYLPKERSNSPLTVMRNGQMTSNTIEDKSPQLQDVRVSPYPSGVYFSRDEHRISRKFSPVTTPPPLIQSSLNPLERGSRLPSPSKPQPTKLRPTGTGVLRPTSGSRPSHFSCLGRRTSCEGSKDISQDFLSTSTTICTPESLTLTRLVDSKSKARSTCDLTPSRSSDVLKSRTFPHLGWSLSQRCNNSHHPQVKRVSVREQEAERNRHVSICPGVESLVTTGIAEHVTKLPTNARASTSAVAAEEGINEEIAPWQKLLNESIARGPRFRRRMIWGDGSETLSGTALWTETAEPLPRPPLSEYENVAALGTIAKYPDLFKVSTPINFDRFEMLLSS